MKIQNFSDLKSLFFDNKTIKQTIFKNTFWLGIGTTISRLLKLVLIIYVARILGATEYGKFTFALAFVSLFIIFSNLGLRPIITREFAREEERKKEFYSILSLKILLSLGALILILIGSFFVTPDETIRKLIWIIAIFVLINSFYSIIYGFFAAHQRMEYEALGEILNALVVTGAGLFVIFNFPSVVNLSYAYLFASTTALIFILALFHFRFLSFKLYWRKAVWKKFLSMSWPLALAGLFCTVYNNIDSVMMGYFGQITETGWYNAAYRIVNIALFPMGLVAASFFPVLSKFARPAKNSLPDKIKEAKESLQKIWSYNLEIMILLAFPLMVGGVTFAPRFIGFIYGQDFFSSILAFQILIIMAGIIFLYVPFYNVLTASGQQKKILLVSLAGAIINVVLNLILIPKFSLYGAASATVVTHLFMFALFFKFTSKFTSIRPLNLKLFFSLIIVSFSSILMYFVISNPLIYNLNAFFSILIGLFVYCIAFFSFKFIGEHLAILIRR